MSTYDVNQQIVNNFALSLDAEGRALCGDRARAMWRIIRDTNESELHLVERYAPQYAERWRNLRDNIDQALQDATTEEEVVSVLHRITKTMMGEVEVSEGATVYRGQAANLFHLDIVNNPESMQGIGRWE